MTKRHLLGSCHELLIGIVLLEIKGTLIGVTDSWKLKVLARLLVDHAELASSSDALPVLR